MIKRTIEVSEGPTHLSVELDQLVLVRQKLKVASIPCEDVGVLLLDHHSITYSHAALTRLLGAGAVIILCGEKHLPVGILLSNADNQLTARRMRQQAAMKAPLRKRLWQQIVRHKVRGQATVLAMGHPMRLRLLAMAAEVVSGDRTNIEGQAARFYWPALFGHEFRRDPDGLPPNSLLNYGYMVFRAACARAITAAGLHPVFSLQHTHRNNAFALADDLVELFRPSVDRAVFDLVLEGGGFIDRPAKQKILSLLTEEIVVAGQGGPLMVQLHRIVASLVRCCEGTSRQLDLPEQMV